jgi:hypothetical protein
MRATLRIAFIVLATAFALLVTAPDIALPWHPWSWYGFNARRTGEIVRVDREAAERGLRVGDVALVARLAPLDRLHFLENRPYARQASALRLPLTSGTAVTLVGHPKIRTPMENGTDILQVLCLLLYAVIAATLVLLRPMPATWAFFLFSYYFIVAGSYALFSGYAPPAVVAALTVVTAVAQAIAPVALIVFALRFPNVRLDGAVAKLERVLIFGAAPLLLAWNAVYATLLYLVLGIVPPPWAMNLYMAVQVALFAAAGLLLIYRYLRADDETRARLQWVVVAFSLAFLPFVILVAASTAVGRVGSVWLGNLMSTASIAAPIALAYTILRHKLFDIRLVVSRALIYAVLTTVTVGILALADWGFGLWLSQTRFALAAEAGLALVLGFSLTTLHRRVESFLNAVIFRAQTIALEALRRFTHEVELITDPQRLLAQTYEALHDRSEAEYVAIYTADGASFVRAAGDGPSPDLLPGDDFAVLRLRRWSEPFECDTPRHPLLGALLLPMTARTQLVGFIACGQKRDRTHYLPEEIETLSALAHRTGSAYAWLTLRPASAVVLER